MLINFENMYNTMLTFNLRNLVLALLLCSYSVVVADTTAPATATVDAVLVLQQELLDAKTPAEIEAAKAKALAAGVPINLITSTVSTTLPARTATISNVAQAQPTQSAVKKSVSIGGSTTVSANSIPAGSTNIGDTGSTYN